MGFKDLHLKLKASRLRRFLIGDGESKKKRGSELGSKPSWMAPVSHGYYVADYRPFRDELDDDDDRRDSDSGVVVQREEIEGLELWYFGVFDPQIGDGVAKYMQSNLFDKKPKQYELRRKSMETMRKAYAGARGRMREAAKVEEKWKPGGSASALVINGERLVMAYIGDYRAVVCRDGEAYPISRRNWQGTKRHWSRKLFPGLVRIPKVCRLASEPGSAAAKKPWKSLEIVVGDERIDSDTEFVILASAGIWKVMENQEAVNLIKHKEDPQDAAECLAMEAANRMSKSSIACLVIRFD